MEIVGIILSVAFALWAGVVAFAARLLMRRIESIEQQIAHGILPRAEERVNALEKRVERLCEP